MYYPVGRGSAFAGLGNFGAFGDDEPAEASAGGNLTTWVSGAIILGLAVLVFAVDTKDPLKLKSSR